MVHITTCPYSSPLNSAAAVVSDLSAAPVMTPCCQLNASYTRGTPMGRRPPNTMASMGTPWKTQSSLTELRSDNLASDSKHVSPQIFILNLNALWFSDVILFWYRKYWSILIAIIACCLVAPSHYLNLRYLVTDLYDNRSHIYLDASSRKTRNFLLHSSQGYPRSVTG